MREAIKYFFVRLYHRFWLKSTFLTMHGDCEFYSYCDYFTDSVGNDFKYVGNKKAVCINSNPGLIYTEDVYRALTKENKEI